MWRQFFACVLVLGLLSGCKDEKLSPSAFISGAPNLQIEDQRYVSLGDASGQTVGGQSIGYIVMKVKLTSPSQRDDFAPQIQNFVLTDNTSGVRYFGQDSGSSALIGISNNYSVMKHGESREFGVGFRAVQSTTGNVAYEQ